MAPAPDVYDAAQRRRALRREIEHRERDGWMVVDRQPFEVTLMHEVRPPWRLAVVDVLLAAIGGGRSPRRRHLHVEAFENGRLFRATVGDVPGHWPQRFWEVPDGWADAAEGAPRPARD